MPQSKLDHRPEHGIPLSSGTLIGCPGCEKLFQSRRTDQRYCSSKCRLVGFQQKQEKQRRERDAQVRMKLREILHLLTTDPHHQEDGDDT